MAKTLPNDIKKKVQEAVFRKADEFCYANCGRNESGMFMDRLVEDPEVGGVLKEFLPKERVRTYIKDGILNAYTKSLTKSELRALTPERVINNVFGEKANVIQKLRMKQSVAFVLRSDSGTIYVVSEGSVLKWETSLRKALEIIANEPNLIVDGKSPLICLKLSLVRSSLTEAEKNHIITALKAVGDNVVFCGN